MLKSNFINISKFIIKIYYQNLLSKFIIKIYYQNLLSKFIIKIYYQNLLLKNFYNYNNLFIYLYLLLNILIFKYN